MAIAQGNMGKKMSVEARKNQSRGKGGRPFGDQYGNEYYSIPHASNQLGIPRTSIHNNLHGVTKHARGRIFKFVAEGAAANG